MFDGWKTYAYSYLSIRKSAIVERWIGGTHGGVAGLVLGDFTIQIAYHKWLENISLNIQADKTIDYHISFTGTIIQIQ